MRTYCSKMKLDFNNLHGREVVGNFDGGKITSDGGGQLLRGVDDKLGIIESFSECFTDFRDENKVEHKLEELLSQRIYGLALGYEDLNDHDSIRSDVNMAVLCSKEDPTGLEREKASDCGKPLAGKSTLNRLELTKADANEESRYKKIVIHPEKADNFFVDIFLKSHTEEPNQIVLDLDATDDPLHGNQEGKFFHGYYKSYCYLPLYIFCGDDLLVARLRRADQDPAAGALDEIKRVVERIRQDWPNVRIIVRGDAGFSRDDIMDWCENSQNIDYAFGFSKNSRLNKIIKEDMVDAEIMYRKTGKASRVYDDFEYQTLKSWSRPRRVVSKAEFMSKGANPRFVVTSIQECEMDAKTTYESFYCARGDMENRIKEQQLGLFADRTSASEMDSNQTRLYFSSVAYTLLNALRRFGLKGTEMEKAQCGTIRSKLLKIGAQIKVTVRKVWVSFTDAYPFKQLLKEVLENIKMMPNLA